MVSSNVVNMLIEVTRVVEHARTTLSQSKKAYANVELRRRRRMRWLWVG